MVHLAHCENEKHDSLQKNIFMQKHSVGKLLKPGSKQRQDTRDERGLVRRLVEQYFECLQKLCKSG